MKNSEEKPVRKFHIIYLQMGVSKTGIPDTAISYIRIEKYQTIQEAIVVLNYLVKSKGYEYEKEKEKYIHRKKQIQIQTNF